MAPIITTSLQETLLQKPNLAQVHFSADGKHHFRVFELNKKLYSRLQEVPEKTKQGIATKKFIMVPILDLYGKEDARFVIDKTMTREQVLSATPIKESLNDGPSKADVLASLGVSAEEFAAVMGLLKKNK